MANDQASDMGVASVLSVGSDFEGDIVLAAHFDPATIARRLDPEPAAALHGLSGPPGIPIEDLAQGLVSKGYRTVVMGGLHNGPELCVRSSLLGVVLYRKRGRAAWILDGYSKERQAILRQLSKLAPSVVHAHWTEESARAVADWDGPRLLTVHDAAWEHAKATSDWKWSPVAHATTVRWLANTVVVLKKFKHVVAVSPYVENYLRQTHGFRGEVRVIPNAIPPMPSTIQVPEIFPKSGTITFGCCGTPGRLKNLDVAIEAFLLVRKTEPNSRLVVYGEGWERSRTRYDKRGIEFRGVRPHLEFLSELAAEVDVWVHPSRIETQSIVICEAIQAGCAVIAGRASGAVPWTLDGGRAGILIDVRDPAEVAQSMLALVRDRDRARSLVAYGQRMVRARFSPETVLDMHLDYYRDVIRAWKRI